MTTTLTTRLRELMEEATPGPWELSYTVVHGKRYGLNGIVPSDPAALQQISGSGGARSYTRYVIEPDMMHDNIENECRLIVELVNNAPTIIRLLEAVDEVSDDMLAAFNASVEASLPYVRMKYDNDTLRRAIAATLRAAREGAR